MNKTEKAISESLTLGSTVEVAGGAEVREVLYALCDTCSDDEEDGSERFVGTRDGESWSVRLIPTYGMLHDYKTGEILREATKEEFSASKAAGESDGGSGVIDVDGRSCYVA